MKSEKKILGVLNGSFLLVVLEEAMAFLISLKRAFLK